MMAKRSSRDKNDPIFARNKKYEDKVKSNELILNFEESERKYPTIEWENTINAQKIRTNLEKFLEEYFESLDPRNNKFMKISQLHSQEIELLGNNYEKIIAGIRSIEMGRSKIRTTGRQIAAAITLIVHQLSRYDNEILCNHSFYGKLFFDKHGLDLSISHLGKNVSHSEIIETFNKIGYHLDAWPVEEIYSNIFRGISRDVNWGHLHWTKGINFVDKCFVGHQQDVDEVLNLQIFIGWLMMIIKNKHNKLPERIENLNEWTDDTWRSVLGELNDVSIYINRLKVETMEKIGYADTLSNFYIKRRSFDKIEKFPTMQDILLSKERNTPTSITIDSDHLINDIIKNQVSNKSGARVLIRGPLGMGKSVLAYQLVKKIINVYEIKNIIPIIISCRFIDTTQDESTIDFLERIMCKAFSLFFDQSKSLRFENSKILRTFQKHPNMFIFILDDLDEVTPRYRESILRAIKDSFFPSAIIYLGRPHSMSDTWITTNLQHNLQRTMRIIETDGYVMKNYWFLNLNKIEEDQLSGLDLDSLRNIVIDKDLIFNPLYLSVLIRRLEGGGVKRYTAFELIGEAMEFVLYREMYKAIDGGSDQAIMNNPRIITNYWEEEGKNSLWKKTLIFKWLRLVALSMTFRYNLNEILEIERTGSFDTYLGTSTILETEFETITEHCLINLPAKYEGEFRKIIDWMRSGKFWIVNDGNQYQFAPNKFQQYLVIDYIYELSMNNCRYNWYSRIMANSNVHRDLIELVHSKNLTDDITKLYDSKTAEEIIKISHNISFENYIELRDISINYSTEDGRIIMLRASKNCNFDNFKLVICKLESLVTLHINRIGMKKLPECIGDLENLQHIDIGNNKIVEIPESIGNLKALTNLHISGNTRLKLPENIIQLNRLQRLNIAYCALASLPSDIGQLKQLKYLDLQGNSLVSLPSGMDNLDNLNYVNLNRNNLQKLPDNFGNLKKIEYLYLNNNKLSELPKNFGMLEKLIYLDLNENKMTEMPESICKLGELIFLYLSLNQIEKIPPNIDGMIKLEYLNLNNNNLENLPDEITKLENLQILSLGDNKIGVLPEFLDELSSLKRLNVENNSLNEFPQTENLENIAYINVRNNEIHKLPTYLTKLESLRYLDIRDNPWINSNQFQELINGLRENGCKIYR